MKKAFVLLIGLTQFVVGTSLEDRYACQYPGCTCEELKAAPRNFSLTCHVTSKPSVGLPPRNVSINVVNLTLLCGEGQGDPYVLLDNIKYDLLHVQALTLKNCVTSLGSVLNTSEFPQLAQLSLYNTILSDPNVGDILYQYRHLTTLDVSWCTRVRIQSICSLTSLFQLIFIGNHLQSADDICDKNLTFSNLKKLDFSHNDLISIPSLVSMAPHLSELYLQHNKISEVPPDVFKSSLTVLDLSSNNLTSLPVGLLSHQSALRHLDLSSNQLTAVPEVLLENTANLRHLDLSFNRLRYLQSNVFKNLQNLNILNLSSNSIPFLLHSHLVNLKNLKYLDLGNNSLRNIPVLTYCRQLEVVDLRQNQIRYILGSSLRGLSNLAGIGMRYNRLNSLPLAAIAVSRKLIVLDFSHNNISHIDYNSEVNVSVDLSVTDSLSVLSGVRFLLLNNNQLKSIYRLSRVFTGVESLWLHHNQLSVLRGSDFPPSLRIIDLSYNRIHLVETDMFRQFYQLEKVSLQFNYPYLKRLLKSAVTIDDKVHPKPQMYISGNLFTCDCNLDYLKAYSEQDKYESFRYVNKILPTFTDLHDVLCVTERDRTMRRLVEIPEEDFICEDEDEICESYCPCCLDQGHKECPCSHVCPDPCTCSQAGSAWGGHIYRAFCENSSLSTVPQGIPTPTTYLHLEHTNITKLVTDQFVHLKDLKRLYLNYSQISNLLPGCFNGLSKLTHLYLSHNQLRSLSPLMWTGLDNLTHLGLQNNELYHLEPGTFHSLSRLEYLNLSNNRLARISTLFFPELPPTTSIYISNNPLSCSCPDIRQTILFLAMYGPNVVMMDRLKCVMPSNLTEKFPTTASLVSLPGEQEQTNYTSHESVFIKDIDSNVCEQNGTIVNEKRFEKQTFEKDNRYAVTLSILSVVLILAVVAAIFLYRKRREIQAWLYVRFGVRVRSRNAGLDETGRTYDAFVSYSSHDEHLVVHELAPKLEQGVGEQHGKRRYQLCLHYRDFPVGDCIADTIIESIESSKRTIMLLSDNFLSSEWCRYEFQTAHHHVLKERSHRLIIVLLHDIEEQKLDPDLRVHLKAGNFLRYNDPWFWEKLYFALPDVPIENHTEKEDHNKNNTETEPSVPNGSESITFKDNKLEIRFDSNENCV